MSAGALGRPQAYLLGKTKQVCTIREKEESGSIFEWNAIIRGFLATRDFGPERHVHGLTWVKEASLPDCANQTIDKELVIL